MVHKRGGGGAVDNRGGGLPGRAVTIVLCMCVPVVTSGGESKGCESHIL